MSEANKALVRRFVDEFWSAGNLAAADELVAPDAAIALPTGERVDREGLKAFAAAWRGAFPDWRSTAEELVAEGERVAERWTGRGTPGRAPRCVPGLAPTGTRVVAPGAVFYRIVGGRITEFRGQFDRLGLLQQLGALAAPAGTR